LKENSTVNILTTKDKSDDVFRFITKVWAEIKQYIMTLTSNTATSLRLLYPVVAALNTLKNNRNTDYKRTKD